MATDTKTKAEETKATDEQAQTTPAETQAPAPAIDLEALKAQIKADILADMKKEAVTAPAEAPAPVPAIDPNNDKVEFLAFKDNDNYKDDITVCVNGRVFKIQRGKRVLIPRYVAAVLENSQDQDTRTANLIEVKLRPTRRHKTMADLRRN
jgi:hypothetical protein